MRTLLAWGYLASLLVTGCSSTSGGGGGGGDRGMGTTSTAAGSQTITSSAEVTSGGVACDDNAAGCQGPNGGCAQCALESLCKDLADACDAKSACVEFQQCAAKCGDASGIDQNCINCCAVKNPDGFDGWVKVYQCIFCTACPHDCEPPDDSLCSAQNFAVPGPESCVAAGK